MCSPTARHETEILRKQDEIGMQSSASTTLCTPPLPKTKLRLSKCPPQFFLWQYRVVFEPLRRECIIPLVPETLVGSPYVQRSENLSAVVDSHALVQYVTWYNYFWSEGLENELEGNPSIEKWRCIRSIKEIPSLYPAAFPFFPVYHFILDTRYIAI